MTTLKWWTRKDTISHISIKSHILDSSFFKSLLWQTVHSLLTCLLQTFTTDIMEKPLLAYNLNISINLVLYTKETENILSLCSFLLYVLRYLPCPLHPLFRPNKSVFKVYFLDLYSVVLLRSLQHSTFLLKLQKLRPCGLWRGNKENLLSCRLCFVGNNFFSS